MTRTKHSYRDLARAVGVRWCDGHNPVTGLRCHKDHRLGTVTEGTVHLTDRRTSLNATVIFLRLAARVLDPSIDAEVGWRRSYLLAKAVSDLSRKAHVRLPRRVFDFERAFTLAGVAGLTNDVPLRKQAFDWARR
jgi:hypothetical protein